MLKASEGAACVTYLFQLFQTARLNVQARD